MFLWRGDRNAYINPRLILPAMVNFSRCCIWRGQTMIQGKVAKKKSTRIVETGQVSSLHTLALGQGAMIAYCKECKMLASCR